MMKWTAALSPFENTSTDPAPATVVRKVMIGVANLFLLFSLKTAPALAASGSPEIPSASAIAHGWSREGSEFHCKFGTTTLRIGLNERHSWDDLNIPPEENAFAWTAGSGAFLASFDYKKPGSVLRYYDAQCRLLFSRPFEGEVKNFYQLLEGRRLLAFIIQPYDPETWGESWVEFGDIWVIDDSGKVLFSTGPYEAGPDACEGGIEHDRFCQVYVSSVRNPVSLEWSSIQIMVDALTGVHYAHWVNEEAGRPKVKMEVDADGKLTLLTSVWLDRSGKPIPAGHPRPADSHGYLRVVDEYQFPKLPPKTGTD